MGDHHGKTILVTGGAGFIGFEFVAHNLNNFKKIYVIDSLTYAADIHKVRLLSNMQTVELIVDDINNANKYAELLGEVDFIVHFAAETHVDNSISSSEVFINSNVVGTYKLLEQFRFSNPKGRFLHVSTDEVYGSVTKPASEFTQLNPSSQYSASKAAAEHIVLANSKTHGQNIVVTRSCNNYGPQQHIEKLIPNVVTRLLTGDKARVYGDGKNIREWIHVIDHCEALVKVLIQGQSGKVYNVGSGNRVSNAELIKSIIQILDVPKENIEHVPDRLGHDFSYMLDSSKILSELQWKSRIDFFEGLKATVNSYRQNLLPGN